MNNEINEKLNNIWQWTNNVLKFGGNLVKEAFITSPLRTATSIGLELGKYLAGDDWKDEVRFDIPDNPIAHFLFGKDPIKDFRSNLVSSVKKGSALAEKYLGKENKGIGEAAAFIGFLGFSTLDLTPLGGLTKSISKQTLLKLAKEVDENVIKNIWKSYLPKANDEIINRLTIGTKYAKTPQEVINVFNKIAQRTVGLFKKEELVPQRAIAEISKLKAKQLEFSTDANFVIDKKLNISPDIPEKFKKEIRNEMFIRDVDTVQQPIKKVSKFWRTIVEKPTEFTDEFKKKIITEANVFYDVISNKKMDEEAIDYIVKNGVEKAERWLSVASKQDFDKLVAMGGRLIQVYSQQGMLDNALKVADMVQDLTTKYGRGIEVWKHITKSSPSLFVNAINKYSLVNLGKELSDDLKKYTVEMMTKIVSEKDYKNQQVLLREMMQKISQEIKPTKKDYLDLWRYASMLSGPLTHIRNFVWNAGMTFIARPLDLFTQASLEWLKHPLSPTLRRVRFSSVPDYYKTIFSSLSAAYEGAIHSFSFKDIGSGKVIDFFTNNNAEAFIKSLQYHQLPKVLRFFPELMERTDKFFSILIANGEKHRLISQKLFESGKKFLTDREIYLIEREAETLAEKFLLRRKFGLDKDDANKIIASLDKLGEFVLNARKEFGLPVDVFVPFVKVPINMAKAFVEFSPLGFWGADDIERISKAVLGSLLTGTAGYLALSDRLTWLPPRDANEKQFFYDSGMMPFSVRIGDKWIPFNYFGILGFNFAIPAALNWVIREWKVETNEDMLTTAFKAAMTPMRFILEQTPLEGLSNLFKTLSGETEYNIASNVFGFQMEQFLPLSGLLRWTNKILDPFYREAKTPLDTWKKDFSFALKLMGREDLLPPAFPSAKEESFKAEIKLRDVFLPYRIGEVEPSFEEKYKEMKTAYLEMKNLKNFFNESVDKIYKLKNEGKIEEAKQVLEEVKSRFTSEEDEEIFKLAWKNKLIKEEARKLGLPSNIKLYPVKNRALLLEAYFENIKKTKSREEVINIIQKLRDLGILTKSVEEEMVKRYKILSQK